MRFGLDVIMNEFFQRRSPIDFEFLEGIISLKNSLGNVPIKNTPL